MLQNSSITYNHCIHIDSVSVQLSGKKSFLKGKLTRYKSDNLLYVISAVVYYTACIFRISRSIFAEQRLGGTGNGRGVKQEDQSHI